MRPCAQSHSTTCRSSLPEASSWPLDEKLMQFTQPSCSSSRCSSWSRFTKEGSPYHCCWNHGWVRAGSWLSCRDCSEETHGCATEGRSLPMCQFMILCVWRQRTPSHYNYVHTNDYEGTKTCIRLRVRVCTKVHE